VQYSLKCAACEHVLTADAGSDEEAMSKLMEAGEAHVAEQHPGMSMSEDEMRDMVRSGMKKEGM